MRGWALLVLAAAAPAEVLTIPNSLDGARQKVLIEAPASDRAVPLLVHLHSSSATFDKSSEMEVAPSEAKRRGWVFVSPDFRGPNDNPEACGSELAIQDVLDAVAEARKRVKIDERRIYLLGGSGGGYMTLVMAAMQIADKDIDAIVRERRMPPHLSLRLEERRKHPVLLRRAAGAARLALFEAAMKPISQRRWRGSKSTRVRHGRWTCRCAKTRCCSAIVGGGHGFRWPGRQDWSGG
jgi:pimeloyl-ACP methyl ester carboxylesterase